MFGKKQAFIMLFNILFVVGVWFYCTYKLVGGHCKKTAEHPIIMTKKMKGTFLTLNPKAKIFEELKTQQLKWWSLLREDNELYIEIRKDNYINVYYYGGSVAKIVYANGFVAETHQKYLGDDKPRGKKKRERIYLNMTKLI